MLTQTKMDALKAKIAKRAVDEYFYESNRDRIEGWEKFFDKYRQTAQIIVENSPADSAKQVHAAKLMDALDVAHALFMEQLTYILTDALPRHVIKEIRKQFDEYESSRIAHWLSDFDLEGIRMDYDDQMIEFSVGLNPELLQVILEGETITQDDLEAEDE